MDRLIAFDPGAHTAAWATFDGGLLMRCGIEQEPLGRALGQRFASIAARVVIELPQVYQQRAWRGDPNDLIAVAVTVGRIMQTFEGTAGETSVVLPHTWKGNVPKAIMGERILGRLDHEERSVLERLKLPATIKHNVIDAIGLGLWALARK